MNSYLQKLVLSEFRLGMCNSHYYIVLKQSREIRKLSNILFTLQNNFDVSMTEQQISLPNKKKIWTFFYYSVLLQELPLCSRPWRKPYLDPIWQLTVNRCYFGFTAMHNFNWWWSKFCSHTCLSIERINDNNSAWLVYIRKCLLVLLTLLSFTWVCIT